MRVAVKLLGIGLMFACGACSESEKSGSEPDRSMARALVIGIDGCRPDALLAADTPNLAGLADAGRASWDASTQLAMPTKSGPGWVSVLTGVDGDKHRVADNVDFTVRNPDFPTFLERAKAHGLNVRVGTGWLHILSMLPDEFREVGVTSSDDYVTNWTSDAISAGEAGLYFVQLDDVDGEGHRTGFSKDNPAYVAEIEDVDQQVGTLLEAMRGRAEYDDEDWLVVVTTDHGGSGTTHGDLTPDDRTIFVVVSGSAFAPGTVEGRTHMDVAPTVLSHLGVPYGSGDFDGTAWRP